MKAALDVHYHGERATAACVLFEDWRDSRPSACFGVDLCGAAPYRAGRFFERELPGLMAVLARTGVRFETIVIDGYVHLKAEVGQGLGARLAAALDYKPVVVGVAKSPLKVAAHFVAIRRGSSHKPLYISSIGISRNQAARQIAEMHGAFRIPTLLKWVDRQARSAPPGLFPREGKPPQAGPPSMPIARGCPEKAAAKRFAAYGASAVWSMKGAAP
jgi:deoxyribonuclease V